MTATLSRRSALTAGVALAAGTAVNLGAIAVVKAAPPADPIFAVLEAHNAAYAHWMTFLKRDDDESDEACEADEAELDAMNALLELPATTAGGLIAALSYLEIHEGGNIAEDVSSFLVSVACAVERIVGPVEARVIRS